MTDQEEKNNSTSNPVRAFLNWIGGLGKGAARIKIGKIEGGRDVTIGDIVGGDKITVNPSGSVGGNLVISVGGQPWKAIPLYAQIVAVLVALGLAFLVFMQVRGIWAEGQPVAMTGDFNIAVAEFQVDGPGEQRENAQRLITGLVNELERVKADELERGFADTIEVYPPSETGLIRGKDDDKRASNAQRLAQVIKADVVIYGSIEVDERKKALVRPRFVINQNRQDEWFEYDEIAGAYRMGSTIPVEKLTNRRFRNDAEAILAGRSRALLYIAAGVGESLAGEYEVAERMFGEALQEETWDTPDVIYVMLGNATLRQGKLEDARGHYENALEQKADYSRAHIGLGSVLYLQALPSAYDDDSAGKGRELDQAVLAEIDLELLGQAIDSYQRALNDGSDRPPLADVTTKANYGLGQALLARALAKEAAEPDSGHQDWRAAREAFQQVIEDYGEGENERVLELAAHAHGRLGRMYLYTREHGLARQAYGAALALLDDLPQIERIEGYVQQYEAARDTVATTALVTPSKTPQARPTSTPSETLQARSTSTPAPAAVAATHQLALDIDLQAVAASDTLAEIHYAGLGGPPFACADLGAYARPTLLRSPEQTYLSLDRSEGIPVCACGYEANETATVSFFDPFGNIVLRYEDRATAARDAAADEIWGHSGITKDYCLESIDGRISRSGFLPDDPLGTYTVEISTQTSQLEFSFDLLPVTEAAVYYSSRLDAHVLVGFEPSEKVQVVLYDYDEDDWNFKPIKTGTLALDDEGVGLLTGISSESSHTIGVIRQDRSDVFDQPRAGSQLDFDALIAQNPTDPNLYFGRAVHDWDVYGQAAIQDLDKAIELDPEFAQAYYERGKVYADPDSDAYDPEQAWSDWSQAIALAPELAPAYAQRGSLYDDWFFGDLDQAIADYGKAIELDPDDLDSYEARAGLYEEKGWLDRAIADYDQIINSLPGDAYYLDTYLYNRANLHDQQGNPDRYLADVAQAMALGYKSFTLDELDRIIEWDPALALAYYLRATTFERETEEAMADLSRAIELDPTHSLAYERRAELYEEQGNEAAAIADLSQVVELNPDSVRPYQARARFYERQGDERSLLAAYDEMVDRFPGFLVARYRRGEVYESLGDHRAAMADYTAVIDQDPDGSPLPYYARGRLHDLGGNREQARVDLVVAVTMDEANELGAIEDYTRAIELDPEFALAYYRRGEKNYFGSGEPALAVEDYTRALKLDPDFAPAYYGRGTIYSRQGEYTLAIEDYTRAMDLDPDLVPDMEDELAKAYYERGQIHSANGDRDLAAADFKRVLELDPRPYLVEQAEASLGELGQPGSSKVEGG